MKLFYFGLFRSTVLLKRRVLASSLLLVFLFWCLGSGTRDPCEVFGPEITMSHGLSGWFVHSWTPSVKPFVFTHSCTPWGSDTNCISPELCLSKTPSPWWVQLCVQHNNFSNKVIWRPITIIYGNYPSYLSDITQQTITHYLPRLTIDKRNCSITSWEMSRFVFFCTSSGRTCWFWSNLHWLLVRNGSIWVNAERRIICVGRRLRVGANVNRQILLFFSVSSASNLFLYFSPPKSFSVGPYLL